MSRFEAWAVHLATLLVGGTGLVYAWMLYALAPVDPYAVIHHPLQPAVQHLHLWAAPLLVFAAGLIWRAHAWEHLESGVRRRRPSGLTLIATLVPMVASGYLIQTAVDGAWRTAWVAVHLTASGLWLLGHAAHAAGPLRKWLRRERPARGDAAPISYPDHSGTPAAGSSPSPTIASRARALEVVARPGRRR